MELREQRRREERAGACRHLLNEAAVKESANVRAFGITNRTSPNLAHPWKGKYLHLEIGKLRSSLVLASPKISTLFSALCVE